MNKCIDCQYHQEINGINECHRPTNIDPVTGDEQTHSPTLCDDERKGPYAYPWTCGSAGLYFTAKV